jgi:hypothetical protein
MTEPGEQNESGSGESNLVSEGRPDLWTWKDFLLFLLLGLPGSILVPVMILAKPDYEMMLFESQTGLRMLGFAIVQQVLGMAIHISWTLVGGKKASGWLSALIAVLLVLLFYLPFIFVVVVGPAAVAIYERLLRK